MTTDPFDQWLNEELTSGYRRISSRPLPASPRYRTEGRPRSARMSLFASLPAALTARLAMGLTAAAMATTGTAAIMVVNTGHHQVANSAAATVKSSGDDTSAPSSSLDSTAPEAANPPAGTHGATVVAAVTACKAALPAGTHGIGTCVSKVASTNGTTQSAAHSQGGQSQGAANAAAGLAHKPKH